MTDEDGIAVRYKTTRKAMEFTGGVEEKSSHLVSGVMRRKGPEMRGLGVAVNHHQYDSEAMGRGETGDEIERQVFPNVGRDGKRLQQTRRFPRLVFGLLAHETLGHEAFDVRVDGGPIKVLAQTVKSLSDPGMAGNGGGVEFLQEGGGEWRWERKLDTALPEKKILMNAKLGMLIGMGSDACQEFSISRILE